MHINSFQRSATGLRYKARQGIFSRRQRAARHARHGPCVAPVAAAAGQQLIVQSLVGNDGGPPRVVCPLDPSMSTAGRSELPLLVYLPGIDGTGLAASRQFPSLLAGFDLRTFVTPPQDRTPFADKVALVKTYLEEEVPRHPPTRPIYLLGESFGGVLAVAVVAECPALVDRVILVNPATSYPRSVWPLIGPLLPQVPAEMYPLLPLALAPVLGNPINLLAAGVESEAPVQQQAAQLVSTALNLLQQLPLLADILPADTLAWKLDLLAQGTAYIAPLLPRVQQRVLVLVGDSDVLIPSGEEGPRLQRALPRAHTVVLKGRSHALLQEGGVNLFRILNEEGFYVTTRRMSAPLKKRGGAGYGVAAPIEVPTAVELERYAERTTRVIRRLSSPIFISTSPEGRRALGLGHIPSGRPLIFVGNHQTLALDLGPLCEQFVRERGMMLRGLAHPVIFQQSAGAEAPPSQAELSAQGSVDDPVAAAAAATAAAAGGEPAGGSGAVDRAAEASGAGGLAPWDAIPAFGAVFSGRGLDLRPPGLPGGSSTGGGGGGSGLGPFGAFAQRGGGDEGSATDGRSAFRDLMTTFGAVPVSGFNLHRLLQNGEAVLLFPGGVREAYKGKGEEYQLFWPEKTEFIRMAARFGATIVPFAGIGVDDSLELLLDSNELERLPLLGDYVRRQTGQLPQARRGVSVSGDVEEKFVAPLALPKLPPSRMYFVFQQPITMEPSETKDRARCEEVYRQVKGSVEEGLAYLLEGRKQDPYADFSKRAFFETIWSGRKQAPTFPLE